MADQIDNDRRQLQRYQLRAPAIVKGTIENQGMVAELYTRDICSGGAFFQTNHPLPTGVSVEITLFLHPHRVKVTTDGTVVRSEHDGMAVAFGEQYQMSPVPA